MLPDAIKLGEIKSILGGYLSEAVSLLDPDQIPDEKSVHDVRVLMKKSKALLKLLKDQIDDTVFKREYAAYREVGRKMRYWRETSVQRKILKGFKKKKPGIFKDLAGMTLITNLLGKTEKGEIIESASKDNTDSIVILLKKAIFRLRFINLNNLDPVMMLKQLELTYLAAGKRFLIARNDSKPGNLHNLRKKTKDLLYQLTFFRAMKPKAIKSMEKKIDSIGQYLGKYNDLAVLIETIGYQFSAHGNNPDSLDELIVDIRNEQDRYLSKVWPEASKIFCPGQKLFNLLGYKVLVL
jgi:CHAD domain-containing protein